MILKLHFKKWLEASGAERINPDQVPDPDKLGVFSLDLKPLPRNEKGMKKKMKKTI
jgi:hypothetical protein